MAKADRRMVDVKFVMRRWSVARRTLHDWIKAGSVPKPLRLGGRRGNLRWFLDEIEAWEERGTR